MNQFEAIAALRATGERLRSAQIGDPVTVVIGGAVAGMLAGELPSSRVTHDCDVLATEPAVGHGAVSRPRDRGEARPSPKLVQP